VKGSRNNHCKAKKREWTTFTKQLLLAGRGREKRRDGDAKQQRSAASRYGVGDIRLVRPSRTAPLTVGVAGIAIKPQRGHHLPSTKSCDRRDHRWTVIEQIARYDAEDTLLLTVHVHLCAS